jgi:glutathione S-transferase
MKLYGSYTSPYVRHCRIALMEEGLDCEFIETDQTQSAELSPTKKVPFLQDGDLVLSDSSAILKYIREKGGKQYLADVKDFDLFCFASTLVDSGANVFYLEKFGLKPQDNAYVERQNARIQQGLEILNERSYPDTIAGDDALIRIASLAAWGLFRHRFSLDGLDNLKALLETANQYQPFADTVPKE